MLSHCHDNTPSHPEGKEQQPFEAIFSFWYKDTDFKVIYTGSSEDDLIDGVSLTPAIAEGEGDWYSLDGSKLSGKPAKAGIYIQNGKKVVVK